MGQSHRLNAIFALASLESVLQQQLSAVYSEITPRGSLAHILLNDAFFLLIKHSQSLDNTNKFASEVDNLCVKQIPRASKADVEFIMFEQCC